MKILLCIISAVIVLSASSCKKEAYQPTRKDIEAIADAAVKAHMFKTTSSFVLIDSSFAVQPQLERIKFRFPLDSLRQYGFTETQLNNFNIIDWRKYNIDKAILKSKGYPLIYHVNTARARKTVPFDTDSKVLDSLNLYDDNFFYIPVKEGWNEQKIESQTEEYFKSFITSLGRKETDPYRISTPVFSEDGKYAMITIYTSHNGCTYLFKRQKYGWNYIKILSRWMM